MKKITKIIKNGEEYVFPSGQTVDTSKFVTTNTNQNISGTKTFTNGSNANPALVAKNGMQVGGDDVTSVAQFQARRLVNGQKVKGTFFVNSDARIKYNRTVDGVEDVALMVDDNAMKLAFGSNGRALGTEYEVLHEGNTKTINGESILGVGDIHIEGGSSNIVKLTKAEYEALEEKDPNTLYIITDVEGGSGNANIVELTQEEYDNLEEVDENTIYVISDATSNYYNKTEVDAKVAAATPADYSSVVSKVNNSVYVCGTSTTTNYDILRYSKNSNTSSYSNFANLRKLKMGGTNNSLLSTSVLDMDTYTDGRIDTKIGGLSTINGQPLTNGGDIHISSEGVNLEVRELTQSDYDGLTEIEKQAEALFIITDAALPTEWTGTQEQYNALGTYNPNCTYYII